MRHVSKNLNFRRPETRCDADKAECAERMEQGRSEGEFHWKDNREHG